MLKKLKSFAAIALAVSLLSGITALAATPGESFFSEPPPLSFEPDDDSWLGYKIIPAVDITITALGRDATDMAQDHPIRVWDVSTRSNPIYENGWGEEEPQRTEFDGAVLLGEVLVTPDSPQDSGFHYEELAEPIVLKAGGLYAFVSLEYADGDYMVWPTDVSDLIQELVNIDIAYICEDAHSGSQHGSNPLDAPPVNYWISDWHYGDDPIVRGGYCVGIMSNVNFWYSADDAVVADEEPVADEEAIADEEEEPAVVEEPAVIEAVSDDIAPVLISVAVDEASDDKATPPTSDNAVSSVTLLGFFGVAALGMFLLSAKKRREN